MVAQAAKAVLPPIPTKRYFTIGEVGDLCGVKPHVLRYWEQEFSQLNAVVRRGNRRYYQNHEVLLIRRIRELLYEQGFTINGARNRLHEENGRSGRPVAVAPAPVSSTPPQLIPASPRWDVSAMREGLRDVIRMLKGV